MTLREIKIDPRNKREIFRFSKLTNQPNEILIRKFNRFPVDLALLC